MVAVVTAVYLSTGFGLFWSNGNQTPIAFEKGEYLQNKVSEIV